VSPFGSKPPRGRARAVALQYSKNDLLPKIIASGSGEVARRIVALAEEHQIPVERHDELVELLSKLDVGTTISEEGFRLVAEILCFLYEVDRGLRAVDQLPALREQNIES
jgi:flagellar biosynthesis protein